jgi:hypothetical protein
MAAVLGDNTPNNFLLVHEPPGTPFAPFTALTDTDALNVVQTVTIALTATGSSTAVGSLTDPSGTLTQDGNTFTEPVVLAASGDGTSLLQRLVYTPTALTPGQSNQITMRVVANDQAASNTTTDTFDVDTAPLITGPTANQPANVGQTVTPFGGVVLTDGDFQTASATPGTMDTATITLTSGEPTILTGNGISQSPTNPDVYTLSAATPPALQTELRGLAFDPTVNDDGKTISMTLAITDVAANLTTTNNITSVVVPPAAPPTFTGPLTPQMVPSGSTINPFNGITVQDKQLSPTENVTITVLNSAGTATDANGIFNPSTYFVKTGVGVYTSTKPMDPFTLSNALAALVFNPTPDVGVSSVVSKIQLTVTDAENDQSAAATPVMLTETPVPAVAPKIIGLTPVRMIAPIVTPFSGVVVDTPDAVDGVTITVDQNGRPTDAGGTFTQPATGPTLKETSPGVYTFTGPLTPAALTQALGGLQFDAKSAVSIKVKVAEFSSPAQFELLFNSQMNIPIQNQGEGNTLITNPGGDNNNDVFACFDSTTGQSTISAGTPYSGPASGLTSEFILASPDNINVTAEVPNAFIQLYGGRGEDAINVSLQNGNNTLDATGGSNFLVGGAGNDTFFLDDLDSTTPIWSTLVNFHAGDSATVWGVTAADFSIAWVAAEGAPAYSGLTAHITAAGKPAEYLTLAGLTPAELSSGKLAVQFGNNGGTPYMEISHV